MRLRGQKRVWHFCCCRSISKQGALKKFRFEIIIATYLSPISLSKCSVQEKVLFSLCHWSLHTRRLVAFSLFLLIGSCFTADPPNNRRAGPLFFWSIETMWVLLMGSFSSVIESSISGRSGRYTQVLFQGIYSSTFDVVWISSFSKYSPKNWFDVRDTIDDYIITSGNHYSNDWVMGERSRLNNSVNIGILSLQSDLSGAMVWPPHPPSPRYWSEIVDFHLMTATWGAFRGMLYDL